MKLSRNLKMLLLMASMLGSIAQAKSSGESFEAGLKKYMASNCAEAMDPLYQATLTESANQDRALLYLAHCQSVFARNLDAAYNLDRVNRKKLSKDDQKLYKELMAKHRGDIDTLQKLYFNLTPYAGQTTTSPDSVKDKATFYGASATVSRPTWLITGFYETYRQEMTPAAYKSYTQTMVGGQLGYFVLPSWRLGASYTGINGSNDQLKSIKVLGVQTDYYFTSLLSVFLEYYSSTYPKLMADSLGKYRYGVDATQFTGGLNFPIFNGAGYGVNGTASYTTIKLTKEEEKLAIANKNLADDPSRFELVLAAYVRKVDAAITYWSGEEVLGVRSRGSVVYNSTDLHKGGSKLKLGYTFNKYVGIGASYAMETYRSTDTTFAYRDFDSTTMTGLLNLNW